jgi:phenylacetic acid degradation operon negative regulatory protein
MRPRAKKLILGLLLAAQGRALSVRDAIAACALFDISANSVRVNLVRMSSEGLIQSAGRGAYVLGAEAEGFAAEVNRWHSAEQRLRPWNGQYMTVYCGALGRSDRVALRQRERALRILGLQELERGLYLRPDNLAGGVDTLRQRLHVLGMEASALVFVAHDFDPQRQVQIPTLWNTSARTLSYRNQRERLEAWLACWQDLEPDVAARESYLLGGQAIRQLVFDPWLPEAMIDARARQALVKTVQRFDETGKAIWQQRTEMDALMPMAVAASNVSSIRLQ